MKKFKLYDRVYYDEQNSKIEPPFLGTITNITYSNDSVYCIIKWDTISSALSYTDLSAIHLFKKRKLKLKLP